MEAAKFGHDFRYATKLAAWCSSSMPNYELKPSPADKQAFKDLLLKTPLWERGQPLMTEMLWVLHEKPAANEHQKILPDYCYNIFEVFRKTYFKAFPSRSETIKTTGDTVQIDLIKMGALFGIFDRCSRYVDMEAADSLNRDGLGQLTPEKTSELLPLIFGSKYMQANQNQFTGKTFEKIALEMLEGMIAQHRPATGVSEFKMNALARQQGVQHMADLNEGKGQGLTKFMDEDGELKGESPRAGTYVFLLLVWPEIKEMLDSNPKKTLSDLHEWLLPFMRAGVLPFLEPDTLCDFCEPPPRGIGLSLRPFRSRDK
ncbi:MAG TPA: hypothetical protein VMV89_03465 [Candidatus Paceibacterota bacterium]|nr:hypothetical protein [Candidatus Paceibacterota bacterium]